MPYPLISRYSQLDLAYKMTLIRTIILSLQTVISYKTFLQDEENLCLRYAVGTPWLAKNNTIYRT